MCTAVQKITKQFSADTDIDILEEALEQASRAHQKAFDLDRITEDCSEGITEDQSECIEDFWCDEVAEVSTGVQISTQLLDLVQDLKLCSSEEFDDEDESEILEQALGLAAQQYEKSFASERLAFKELDSDDSELFHDCVDFSIPQDHFNYMPFALGTCQISDELLDMVQDMKGMKMIEADDLDELFFESTDFKSELELSMLEDMNNLQLELPVSEPELVAKNVVAEPTKPKTMAVNWSVRSSVLIASASAFLFLVDTWVVGMMELM